MSAPPVRFRRTPRRAGLDLTRVPLLGPLLRWRHARLVFQFPLLIVAGLILFDGFTGPQLAPENFATTLAWVHYRGLLVVALLLVGNLFCMGCPFMLPRALAKRLMRPTRRWPRVLRNKWAPVAGLLLILWAYEAFGLWSSPLLTAWVAVAYFAAAMVIDGMFEKATFCKYVCPLGLFNFVYGTVSPAKISAANPDVCRTCVGKECVNGRAATPASPALRGCELGLFVPTMATSMDCTLCLDCLHACPHDNVALTMRAPAVRLIPRIEDAPPARGSAPRVVRWPFPARLDLACLFVIGLGAALMNALAMTGPGQGWIAALTQATLHSRPVTLVFVFGVGMVAAPLLLGWGAAAWARVWARASLSARTLFARMAPAYVPLGFGVWGAHYGFHFLTGALTVVPIAQQLATDFGIGLLGSPAWGMGALVPPGLLYPIQSLLVEAGLAAALFVAYRLAEAWSPKSEDTLQAFLPQAILLIVLALAALWIFRQPMQMRGTLAIGG